MIAIVCLDDKDGMMFNNRRQSQDRVLRERVVDLVRGGRLLMNSYSAKQFADQIGASEVVIEDNFLSVAQPNDYCFVENTDLAPYIDKIDRLIIYRWNRLYPKDVCFSINLKSGWRLCKSTDFEGYSHAKITEEIYCK